MGFKAISETVESGASIWVDPKCIQIVMPTDFQLPPGGLGIRNLDPPLEAEKHLRGPKMVVVVMNGDMNLGADAMMEAIRGAAGDKAVSFVDGTGLATAILGDSITTNLLVRSRRIRFLPVRQTWPGLDE